MGNTSSKAVRKLPKHTETPTWAGARVSRVPSDTPVPRSSETKNEGKFADSGLSNYKIPFVVQQSKETPNSFQI